MDDLYQHVMEHLEEGRPCVLATVISQAGPAPRGIGAKCLIAQAGLVAGSVGGGLLEARTLDEARKVFDSALPQRIKFTLKGTDVAATDMLCGGDVEVFLEPISGPARELMPVYEKVVRIGKRGGSGILATILDETRWTGGRSAKIYMDRRGEVACAFEGAATVATELRARLEAFLNAKSPMTILVTESTGDRIEVFVEPLVSAPILYVFGGGHVSRQIVPLASRVGFDVEVIDDREEFAAAESFPEARAVHVLPFGQVMDRLSVDAGSYLVIVTRGHLHDKEVLVQALRTPARYVGMIGSRRKRDMIYAKLLEEGFSRGDLSRVHCPVGLAIGAETPEEIAVSIVAELIQVRAGAEKA